MKTKTKQKRKITPTKAVRDFNRYFDAIAQGISDATLRWERTSAFFHAMNSPWFRRAVRRNLLMCQADTGKIEAQRVDDTMTWNIHKGTRKILLRKSHADKVEEAFDRGEPNYHDAEVAQRWQKPNPHYRPAKMEAFGFFVPTKLSCYLPIIRVNNPLSESHAFYPSGTASSELLVSASPGTVVYCALDALPDKFCRRVYEEGKLEFLNDHDRNEYIRDEGLN